MANPFADLVPGGTATAARPVSSRNPFADLIPSSATFVEPDRVDPGIQSRADLALLPQPRITVGAGGVQIPVGDIGPRVTVEPPPAEPTPSRFPPAMRPFTRPDPVVRGHIGKKEMKQLARVGTSAISGTTLGVADAAAKRVSGGRIDSLAGIVDDMTGFKPTQQDITTGDIANFVGGVGTTGKIVTPIINRIAARSALKIMLNEGVKFGGRKAAVEIADKFINNDPVDVEGIHFDSGLGVLFGGGEVGLQKFISFTRGVREARRLRAQTQKVEVTRRPRLRGRIQRPELPAKPKVEVETAQAEFKSTGDIAKWNAVRDKYIGLDPKKTPIVQGFGRNPLARSGPTVNPFADIVPGATPRTLITPQEAPDATQKAKTPSAKTPAPVERVEPAKAKVTKHKTVQKAKEVADPPVQVVKSHKLDVLPRKKEILAEIDTAIKEAKKDGDKAATVHFEINGGVDIHNDPKVLAKFRGAVKAVKSETLPTPPSKPPTAKGGMKKAKFDEFHIAGPYTSDGTTIMKAPPPKGAKPAKAPPRIKNLEGAIESILKTDTTPAEFQFNYHESQQFGPAISKKPLPVFRGEEVAPQAIFKDKFGDQFNIDQRRLAAVNKALPKIENWGVVEFQKGEKGARHQLTGYIKGKPVAAIGAQKIPGWKIPKTFDDFKAEARPFPKVELIKDPGKLSKPLPPAVPKPVTPQVSGKPKKKPPVKPKTRENFNPPVTEDMTNATIKATRERVRVNTNLLPFGPRAKPDVSRIGEGKLDGKRMRQDEIQLDKGVSYNDLAKELSDAENAMSGVKPFTPDPKKPAKGKGKPGFAGVAGRPGGKTAKPWLDKSKVKSPDKEIESFFQQTNKMPGKNSIADIIAKGKEQFREAFIFLQKIPKTKEGALARDIIRTMPEQTDTEAERALHDYIEVVKGDGSTEALSPNGLDLLRRKIFAQDQLKEAQLERSVARDLTADQWQTENERLDDLIKDVPSVQRAFEARQRLWKRVSNDLFDRGLIDETAKNNNTYVRHYVLIHMEKGLRAFANRKKALKEGFRPSTKARTGSHKDPSTKLLDVEVKALAEIYRDNAIDDIATEVGRIYNQRHIYTPRAKAKNFERLVGGPEVVARIGDIKEEMAGIREQKPLDKEAKEMLKALSEELWELDPTMPFKKRKAIGFGKLEKILDAYSVDMEVVKSVAKNEPQSEAGIAALSVLNAINEQAAFIKDTLGDQFVTPESLAQDDGLVEWWYKRPNTFYMATTLDEAKLATLLENSSEDMGESILIPKSAMREALAMGAKRKGMLIPKWLAETLDNLPVNHRDNLMIESFTSPAIKAWKRWVLRVNPLRYNFRNQLGDMERLHAAGQTGAIKLIPEAISALVHKSGPAYQAMRKYGAAGSSLWHEMGDPTRHKEFERFSKLATQKDFEHAVKRIVGAPIRAIQGLGNIEQSLTQAREDILRAAVYLDTLRKLKAGKPVRHWAGRVDDIMKIAEHDKERAAAKISRETMGDYGEFTPFENAAFRNGLIPFYSWMKINGKFWSRVARNAAKEGDSKTAGRAAARAVFWNTPKWLVRVSGIYGAGFLWNHRDEDARKKEATLDFWLRAQPHVNIGDTTLWGDTALSDYGEWFAMEKLAGINWRREAGFLTAKEAALESAKVIAQSPVNKIFQALNPITSPKPALMAVGGIETFPDVFNPRLVAKPGSRKAIANALLNIMGADAKKFYQTAKGDRKIEDTLYAYFAGWWARPTSPEKMIDDLKRTKAWVSLKAPSKTTGRPVGGAVKGREAEHQEFLIRRKAVKK